jgi:hypothetical protein
MGWDWFTTPVAVAQYGPALSNVARGQLSAILERLRSSYDVVIPSRLTFIQTNYILLRPIA